MAFGKLYSIDGNPRTTAIKAVAVANNIDLEFVNTDIINGVDAEFLKINPLGKIPTFVGADGFVLTEAIAIAIYSKSSYVCYLFQRADIMMKIIVNSYPCLNTPC